MSIGNYTKCFTILFNRVKKIFLYHLCRKSLLINERWCVRLIARGINRRPPWRGVSSGNADENTPTEARCQQDCGIIDIKISTLDHAIIQNLHFVSPSAFISEAARGRLIDRSEEPFSYRQKLLIAFLLFLNDERDPPKKFPFRSRKGLGDGVHLGHCANIAPNEYLTKIHILLFFCGGKK